MMKIKDFRDFINDDIQVYPNWISRYNFTYDEGENEWDREDLDLCLFESTKKDIYERRWTLSKFDDSHEDGEEILFKGTDPEMEAFIGTYIRNNKISEILD